MTDFDDNQDLADRVVINHERTPLDTLWYQYCNSAAAKQWIRSQVWALFKSQDLRFSIIQGKLIDFEPQDQVEQYNPTNQVLFQLDQDAEVQLFECTPKVISRGEFGLDEKFGTRTYHCTGFVISRASVVDPFGGFNTRYEKRYWVTQETMREIRNIMVRAAVFF